MSKSLIQSRALNDHLPALSEYLKKSKLPGWSAKKAMARKKSPPIAPSFSSQLDSLVRQQAFLEHAKLADSPSKLMRRREWAAQFITDAGFNVAGIQCEESTLQELPAAIAGMQSGVIKPIQATNAWGVVPFIREGEHKIKNLFNGKSLTTTKLLKLLHEPMQQYMFPNRWMVEELLLPPGGEAKPLYDYKFYAFKGHSPLVLQVARNKKENQYKWYDRDWKGVETGKYNDRYNKRLPLPADPQVLMDVANKLSAALPLPFCRVDLYETSRGIVVGELTPEPGTYHEFDAVVDEYLGLVFEVSRPLWVEE